LAAHSHSRLINGTCKSAEVGNRPPCAFGRSAIADPGAFSAGDTLVPIPNTTVKARCGDDTPLGESSSVPDYLKTTSKGWFLAFLGWLLILIEK
jgi:hypothetical protein